MEPCEAPELLEIFEKIICDRKKYCYVCLRTNEETLLVSAKNSNKFLNATKIQMEYHFQPLNICYICERQFMNAHKVYHSALFASQLSLVFKELMTRYVSNKNILLDKKYFARLLKKVNLSPLFMPETIEKEIQIIRKNTKLIETETLVMDTSSYPTAEMATLSNRMTIDTTEGVIQIDQNTDHTRSTTPCILPDRDIEPASDNDDNTNLQTIVFQDDDDPIIIPQIKKEQIIQPITELENHLILTRDTLMTFEELAKTYANDKDVNFMLHPVQLDDGLLRVPSLSAVILNDRILIHDSNHKVLSRHPLGIDTELLKQHVLSEKQIFIQNRDSFPVVPLDNVGEMTSDSPSQSILKDTLTASKKKGVKRKSDEIASSNSSDTLNNDTPLKRIEILLRNNETLLQNTPQAKLSVQSMNCNRYYDSRFGNNDSRLGNNDSRLRNNDTRLGNNDSRLGNNDSRLSDNDNVMSNNDVAFSNIIISDITSDMDVPPTSRGDNTDWEDKIPMDVISFVDAVDPNALKNTFMDHVLVSEPRSLANMQDDVIDLG